MLGFMNFFKPITLKARKLNPFQLDTVMSNLFNIERKLSIQAFVRSIAKRSLDILEDAFVVDYIPKEREQKSKD